MLIGIFGENCTGKTSLAEAIAHEIPCEIFYGREYLRLAKSEANAKALFQQMLCDSVQGKNRIYVITEKEHLALLPEGSLRILVTAELDQILNRFAGRMGGQLPHSVLHMLERRHGCFDHEPHHIHVISGKTDIPSVCQQIKAL